MWMCVQIKAAWDQGDKLANKLANCFKPSSLVIKLVRLLINDPKSEEEIPGRYIKGGTNIKFEDICK